MTTIRRRAAAGSMFPSRPSAFFRTCSCTWRMTSTNVDRDARVTSALNDSSPGKKALVALGANLGARERTLETALCRLNELPESRLVARSRWHRTVAVGGPAGQPEFLNGAALLETSLDPHVLLEHLLSIELQLGRERHEWWGARTIDLDLLMHGAETCRDERLELPHPRLICRRFALLPAAEVAPDWAHPRFGWTLQQLAMHMQSAPPRFVVTSVERAAADDFCARLALMSSLAERTAHQEISLQVVDVSSELSPGQSSELAPELSASLTAPTTATTSELRAGRVSNLAARLNETQPKLIVLLAAARESQADDGPAALLERAAFQPFRVPALRVVLDDIDRAVAEAAAALKEMAS